MVCKEVIISCIALLNFNSSRVVVKVIPCQKMFFRTNVSGFLCRKKIEAFLLHTLKHDISFIAWNEFEWNHSYFARLCISRLRASYFRRERYVNNKYMHSYILFRKDWCWRHCKIYDAYLFIYSENLSRMLHQVQQYQSRLLWIPGVPKYIREWGLIQNPWKHVTETLQYTAKAAAISWNRIIDYFITLFITWKNVEIHTSCVHSDF